MTALVIGNSHVAALKNGYDRLPDSPGKPAMAFYCARGADLYFTTVVDGVLVEATKEAGYDDRFRPFSILSTEFYHSQRRPTSSVADQFAVTGGCRQIDLRSVTDIVYVAGLSPYDLLRNGLADPTGMTAARLRSRIGELVGGRYLLADLIGSVRAQRPTCRHHFVGAPVPLTPGLETPADRSSVTRMRQDIGGIAADGLFDSVFAPGHEVLDETLLSAQPVLRLDGRRQADLFQGDREVREDLTHMNAAYGEIVLRTFVIPTIR